MLGWNQRKVLVLRAVKSAPNSTPKDVALKLSISTESAEMELLRLSRQGLLNRVAGAGSFRKPSFYYSLSDRGLSRLAYLEQKNNAQIKVL